MQLTGRFYNGSDYRYGFNGKEKDNELKGDGNSIDYGARMYDPRVGRWFKMDPLQIKYPEFSPYVYGANNPIIYYDFDGRDIVYFDRSGNEVKRIVDKKINKTFVEKKSQDLHGIFYKLYDEAKMPNKIINVGKNEKGRDYNKYDYQIAASTHLINQKINEGFNPFTNEGLPEKQPGTGQPEETIPSLDPNVVKGMVLKETQAGYYKNGWKNGDTDVMQSNVGSDSKALGSDWTKEKGYLTALEEDVVPTPSQSIHNGIIWLYYKGIKVSDVTYDLKGNITGGKVTWIGGDNWETAAKKYNGGGDRNYIKNLNKILAALKINSTKDKVSEDEADKQKEKKN